MWGDLYQHFQIESVRRDAHDANRKADSQRSEIGDVSRQLERLTLVCQAMWELLRDHSGLTEAQLKEKILEIDARDGRVDGVISVEVINCPHCGQKTGTQRSRCVCCGKPVPAKHVFKG